jgi:hypothetical protein
MNGLPCPPTLVAPIAALLAAIQTGLLNGNGTVAGMTTSGVLAVNAAAVVLQTAAAPLIAGADSTLASPATDAVSSSISVQNIIAAPLAPVRQMTMINPNLFSVAAQYLGNPLLWQQIATASGLTDPQPIGQFLIQVPAT